MHRDKDEDTTHDRGMGGITDDCMGGGVGGRGGRWLGSRVTGEGDERADRRGVSQVGLTLIREPPKIASGPGLTLEAA